MKTIILICILCLNAVQQQGQSIPWSESRKLSWDDFKASPDAASTNAAMTNSIINIEFNFDDAKMEYTISCRFNKNRSWVKVRTAAVLQHEQGHFDIAEIFARKLAREMKSKRFSAATVEQDVNNMYDGLMTSYQKFQQLYDQETDFSRNKEKQEEWLKKIAADLKALEPFAVYNSKQVAPLKK